MTTTLEKMKGFSLKRIASSVSWLVADQILRMGFGFLVGVWVARYLGVTQYGTLNYAIAFVTLFNPFVNLGLEQVVVRRLTQAPLERGKVLGTAFFLKLLSSNIVLGLIFCISSISNRGDNQTLYMTTILSVCNLFNALDIIATWFQSQFQAKYIAIAKSTSYLIALLLRVILIWVHAPLISFAYAALAEAILVACILLISYRITRNSAQAWEWDWNTARLLLKESYPLIFSGFAIMIYLRIDQVMLKSLSGDYSVGIYSAATRLSEAFYFIPTIIVTSIAPVIYAAKQESQEYYDQQLQRLFQIMALLAFLVVGLMSVSSNHLIIKLFGESYAPSVQVLSIHIWASIFVFLGSASSPWFVAEQLTHLSLRRTLIGAVTNVLLNLYLIPRYSAVGASIATVVSYSFSDVLSNATHPKTRKLFLIQIQSLALLKLPLLLKLVHK